MYGDRNFTFSVKSKDTEGSSLVTEIKAISIQTGVTFSHIVLAALKKYKEEVLTPSQDKE